MSKPITPIDPESPYYRICPHCKKPHMVHNKGRDYCSAKCYQDFYNLTRKFKKPSSPYPPIINETEKQLRNYQEDPKKEIPLDAHETNQKILSSLAIDKDGTPFKINELASAGFQFFAYNFRYPLNIDQNIYCLEYGQYEAFLIEPDALLIHPKQKSI